MSEESKAQQPKPEITDEMLVRMVGLLLKDIAKLAPYLDRISTIANDPHHLAFTEPHATDLELARFARDQRVKQVAAFAALLNFLILQQMDAAQHFTDAGDAKKREAVAKAMRDLGIDKGQE